jgi:hypothetical protein
VTGVSAFFHYLFSSTLSTSLRVPNLYLSWRWFGANLR